MPSKTVLYNFALQKYFRFEDECAECVDDWAKRQEWHFDLWMGPDAITPGPNLIACENALTQRGVAVELDPPAGYPVDATPLFDGANLQCIAPAPPCQDVGNACGNSCQIPEAATCPALALELLLPLPRFLQLNPKLNKTVCSVGGTVRRGANVCMGGTCGD